MLTLLAVKKTLNKSWVWLKHNWYIPAVIIYTLLLWIVLRKKEAAYKVLEVRNNSYKEQIDAINNAYDIEIKERNKIIEKYNDLIDKLEKQYAEDRKILNDKKKKEVKKLIEEYHNKPEELAKIMADKYGFEYVE
jgi:hypothetical protein